MQIVHTDIVLRDLQKEESYYLGAESKVWTKKKNMEKFCER